MLVLANLNNPVNCRVIFLVDQIFPICYNMYILRNKGNKK